VTIARFSFLGTGLLGAIVLIITGRFGMLRMFIPLGLKGFGSALWNAMLDDAPGA